MAFDLVGKAVKNLRLPTVDYNNSPIKIIPAQAGDINSRYFSVTLYDDRGDISLKNYAKVTLNATLPDGDVQLAEGEIDKVNNCAVCKIAGSMLSQLGKVSCDILFTGNDASGTATSLTSQTFYVFVAKSQAGDYAIEGSDDYTLLVQLLNEVSELEENIETAENARVAAEQARVTAENTRASAESTRTANETARQTAEEERVTAEQARAEELNNKLDKSDIVQTTGQSTTAVMSQKAVTSELDEIKSNLADKANTDYVDNAIASSAVSPTVETETIIGGTKVTITDKDGAHEFDVMNGVNGAAGKSAYASAQDGGFTGTEAQFNKGLSVMGGVSGIDTTVTQNSGNLITSGAVYNYIQSLDASGVKY